MQLLAIFSGLLFVLAILFGFETGLSLIGLGLTPFNPPLTAAFAVSALVWAVLFSAADQALRHLAGMRRALEAALAD